MQEVAMHAGLSWLLLLLLLLRLLVQQLKFKDARCLGLLDM